MSGEAALGAVAYELGEYESPAEQLDEFAQDPDLAAALLSPDAGFAVYRHTDASALQLALPAAQRTLSLAGLDPSDVDAVVVASDCPLGKRDVAEFAAELGTSSACMFNMGLLDCATAMAALMLAASLVRDGTFRHVLVVSVDLVDVVSPASRILAGGAAVGSDAASTALVAARGPLRITAAAQHRSPELARSTTTTQGQLIARIHAHRELFARLAKADDRPPETAARLFPSNFSRRVLRMYLPDVGFSEQQIHFDGIGRIGHCLGSDPLINLADHLRSAELKPGDGFVLLGSGIAHLGAVALRAREP